MRLEERFWAKVLRCVHGEQCRRCCWEWQGTRTPKGYGLFAPGGLRFGAHRLAYEFSVGAGILPRNSLTFRCIQGRSRPCRETSFFVVLHRCDNPPCCNPRHLLLGTNWDNIHDAIRKGLRP